MNTIEKVVLIKNAVETLGYFSEQLAVELRTSGFEVYFVDYNRLVDTVAGLYRFIQKGKTALCTFNFVGISGEEVFIEENGRTIWENYEMPCLNLMVDHPLYYHSKLEHPMPGMKIFCVDREHVTYMKRFYPEVEAALLPLAGNVVLAETSGDLYHGEQGKLSDKTMEKLWLNTENIVPYEKRSYDLVFTGNYTPVEHIYREIENLEEDYRKFYGGITEDLIAHPTVSIDTMLEQHIYRELGEVSDTEKRAAIAGMVFIDICIRSYFRGEIVKSLAEQGITVHVFGANWEKLSCKNPECIISNGREVTSVTCAKAIGNAKISLNIMPWFKDGAHDRVFTAMLQKTLSLTDDSKYLREEFTDGKELVFFSLEERGKLADRVRSLLAHQEDVMEIAENGYRKAVLQHTWKQRTAVLVKELKVL